MKRMIDGIINYTVTTGSFQISGDTEAMVDFNFPSGHWPISLCSKPFSIIPGRLTFDNDDVTAVCWNSTSDATWKTVHSYGGFADMAVSGYSENYIEYKFTFANEGDRDDFIKSLFGESAFEDEEPKFAVPVSMILVPFAGSFES